VSVAAEVARRLDADLDIVVARKLGAPFQPELAVGAVTADGGQYLNEELVDESGATPEFVRAEIAREMAEARRREERLRHRNPAPRIESRTVIVVDDGLATGATMRAAVRSLRARHPARLVVAVPVAPPDTCVALRREADDVIAVCEPDPFLAVGLHYQDFRPIDDEEIERLLDNRFGLGATRA
jgi:predicted phosphoribosyltransferase